MSATDAGPAFSTATPDWLALRAAADDAARSGEFARDVAARLGPGPHLVHDLGSGTGAMMRWLAPLLPGPQRWVLHDGDATILGHRMPGAVADADGRRVAVATSVEPLVQLQPSALRGAALVTASALLDVLTLDEAAAIVAACGMTRAAAFFSLTVTGAATLDPVDPLDGVFRAAFNDHQRRLAARRRLLGPDAVIVVARLFAVLRYRVRTAPTPWLLGRQSDGLLAAWLDGWVGAAVEQVPELHRDADGYLLRRRTQLAAGDLRVAVEHQDLIAWPV